MWQQNLLSESDIARLIKLSVNGLQSRSREALCHNIGVEPNILTFLRESSDYDFFSRLIHYLIKTDNKKALWKLCKELLPIFDQGEHAYFLKEILEKLNYNQEFDTENSNNRHSTSTRVSTNNSIFNGGIFTIQKITVIVFIVIVGGLISYFISQREQPPIGTYLFTCKKISVNNGILTADCGDLKGNFVTTSLEYGRCRYGIENRNGRLECY
ncbi:hypothetical protein G7B40_008305 [Aetokthonos hydrillicola Thurmond2011]|jgi:hypothetical protein|uniref:Uncharacterized protein n=2 Tax=Aetokthonos TaxID=1550243 RepID=A0AAP5M9M7_9CYAN|nr:hypothetical protein [Aetokthonos hydrillicola]MBO3462930.1 hypothetical protein [Aetokthonos hydrillicola CCALA 1050]MBW4585674.1 hypothetical protein [Aetokthonos hydrillicola CCALA 1050]MDR9894574.1 hypothetical protein [Aetokthonos hydrillicola Thurmond2011]